MARKKSNASKKGKSKRSSASTSPTPTPAAIGAGAPEGDVIAVSESTPNEVGGEGGAAEEPEQSPDGGKYAVDVTAELADSGADAATEDQLEDPIVYSEHNNDEQQAVVAEDNSNDIQYQLHIPDLAAGVSGSVNMEDSQAELLSSNTEHSMYRSSIDHSIYDDLYALESKTDNLACLADDSIDAVAAAAAATADSYGNAVTRSYVISPSAFVSSTKEESEDVAYMRPDSATEPSGDATDVQDGADSGAAAVANIVSTLVEAAAAAAAGLSVSTDNIVREAVESSGELLGEHDVYSSIGQISGGHSIAESYIHVDESVGGDSDDYEHTEEPTTDPESDCDPKAEKQQQGKLLQQILSVPQVPEPVGLDSALCLPLRHSKRMNGKADESPLCDCCSPF
ncbi:hypothetical protein GGF38_003799 [Coemansia sp. RSA 25]|nr:hypothetical protein GGF38_003799 [Coemansia sp. RSA 25]